MNATTKREWWKSAVIYQIYPRSFQDSDGDGIGDLEGIRRRLDYLVWLGVDALWLSPFYRSPMADLGYDISDFCDVDPLFGSLETFDALKAEAHARGLKVILDLVPNHTSVEHPWFRESRSSRDNPKRDWYVWRDGCSDGSPPNNWVSTFGGSAWERDEASGQFYYHAFLKEQPDLNWRNPEVVAAMSDVMRFWLDRGADGFRVDAVTYLVEDELLREDPEIAEGDGRRHVFTSDRPETLQCVMAMRQVLDEFPDRVMIGEVHLPVALAVRYYGSMSSGFHLPFNFILLETPWNARSVEAAIDSFINLLPADSWANWVLGNHDEPRIATRAGQGVARVAAMLIMTIGGTPFVYNGDELGLEDEPTIAAMTRGMSLLDDPGHGVGRNPQRTPIPWDRSAGSGFTTGRPWLPIGEENALRDVASERDDERSMLQLYRRLIALRRSEPALIYGEYLACAERGDVMAYERSYEGRRFFIGLNLGDQERVIDLTGSGVVVLSTWLDRAGESCQSKLTLRSAEGVIVQF